MAEAQMSHTEREQEQQIATGDRAILPKGAKTIPIYIMGKKYDVPETLTIMKAMEYAGFQFRFLQVFQLIDQAVDPVSCNVGSISCPG